MEMMNSLYELNFKVGLVSMAGCWLYVGDDNVSLNEQMIEQGYGRAYDGGTKKKILKNYVRYVGLLVHFRG